MANTITLLTVGTVHAPHAEEVEDRDWSDVESEIHVNREFAPGLKGIEDYTDVVVTFLLHKFQFDPATQLVGRRSGRDGAASIGIFAQRTYHRPNAIGSTMVRLLEVRGNVLRVRGLDALDGSPVLDIKPYTPPLDKPSLSLPAVEPEI